MSDNDGDSTMHSNNPSDLEDNTEPDLFPGSENPPPTTRPLAGSELSPPNSQPTVPTLTTTSTTAANTSSTRNALNANGKRVLTEGSNGASSGSAFWAALNGDSAKASAEVIGNGSGGVGENGGEILGRAASGYTWTREEDAPGYAWLNRKAQDEAHRAMENIVDADQMVRGRYGDSCAKR